MNPYQSYESQGLAKGKGHPVVPEPAAAWFLLFAVLAVVVFRQLGKGSR